MDIPFKRLHPTAQLPTRMSDGAAGYDLAAHLDGSVTLAPAERSLVATGLACALPPGWEAQVRPRSGWAVKEGVTVLNSPGTVDADYRGEIKVLLINLGAWPVTITPGQRIAQLVIAPVPPTRVIEVAELPPTSRGAGGFGSTG